MLNDPKEWKEPKYKYEDESPEPDVREQIAEIIRGDDWNRYSPKSLWKQKADAILSLDTIREALEFHKQCGERNFEILDVARQLLEEEENDLLTQYEARKECPECGGSGKILLIKGKNSFYPCNECMVMGVGTGYLTRPVTMQDIGFIIKAVIGFSNGALVGEILPDGWEMRKKGEGCV